MSTLAYASFGRVVDAPIVFADELIHTEMARSIADGSLPSVRGQLSLGYGFVTAVLQAVPYLLTDRLADAYALVKLENSLVMSLAAIPAYLVAKRALTARHAVVVAALTVAVPSMAFTGMVMTEVPFYPVFLLVVLLVVRVVERPSAGRQFALLAGVGLAYATRPQAIVLLPAAACAVLLCAWLDRGSTAGGGLRALLRTYRASLVVLGAGAIAACVGTLARGGSPIDLLGAYSVLAGGYSPTGTAKWTVINLADIHLYVGGIALAVFPLGLAAAFRAGATREQRVIGAVALSFVAPMALAVGAFSSSFWGEQRPHDRNLFYIVPLLLIVLFIWVERGLPRPRGLTLACAAFAVLLPFTIPFRDLGSEAWVDQIGIAAWISGVVDLDAVQPTMVAVGLCGALLCCSHRAGAPGFCSCRSWRRCS